MKERIDMPEKSEVCAVFRGAELWNNTDKIFIKKQEMPRDSKTLLLSLLRRRFTLRSTRNNRLKYKLEKCKEKVP